MESSNGNKQSVAQQLLLRGDRDFASLAVYETLLFDIMDKRNKRRGWDCAESGGDAAVVKPRRWLTLAETAAARPVRATSFEYWKTYSVLPVAHRQNGDGGLSTRWSLEIYYARSTGRPTARLIGNKSAG
ncbi:MAG: hypothetical protein IPM39_28535 [Chloroflexi bacterium]|nr:hypothetical protein [Chloroflexota bacterium]